MHTYYSPAPFTDLPPPLPNIHTQVSHESGKNLEMVVPSKGIWGTASIGGSNIDRAVEGSVNEKISIPSMSLDELINEDVLLMKVGGCVRVMGC